MPVVQDGTYVWPLLVLDMLAPAAGGKQVCASGSYIAPPPMIIVHNTTYVCCKHLSQCNTGCVCLRVHLGGTQWASYHDIS